MKCDVTHSHIKETPESEEEDSGSGSDVGLPLHSNIKTEFLYKEMSMFMGEFPSTVDEINHICSMSVSRNGDIYVIIPAYQYVLKYNKKGRPTSLPLPLSSSSLSGVSLMCECVTSHFMHRNVLHVKHTFETNNACIFLFSF
jgi:hypothetical protein